MDDKRTWLTGNGRGLMIAVLVLCAMLAITLVVVSGRLACRYASATSADRKNAGTEMPFAKDPQATRTRNRKVAPAGNPGSWFATDDYPTAARRREEQGPVSVRLAIDARGRVADCVVLQSSGSPSLDAATCLIATRRARFYPATNGDGQPIASTYALPGVRWQLD
ncbi:MAG: energy transducer TonB [Sphingomonas bacterium]|nr:energy transducer TonB [Sphingomonas bacterium]